MIDFQTILQKEETLDPADWEEMRAMAHRMVDDMLDYQRDLRENPVWRKPTEAVKDALNQPLPKEEQAIINIYEEFLTHILPYNKGNVHPRFWGWVQGTGTPLGMLADMLASGMNPNNTIGDHAAMYVENQVIDWCKIMMGFPIDGSGLLVSGASMANVTAMIVARNWFEEIIREKGLYGVGAPLVMYCSTETHNCLFKAAEAIGIGQEGLRKIPVNEQYQIDIEALKAQIAADRAAGFAPFCVVGNAGTVNTGAIDDLKTLREITQKENLWFHVDGAFGALAKLTPEYAEVLKPIEKADSLAFDLHKWMYMPYEVACVLIRCQRIHRNAFSLNANYLLHHERGLSAGPDAKTNYGLELSRGFKALKVWMSLKEHGIKKYARLIRQNIAQTFYLGWLIEQSEDLELLAPVTMNIVCFRYHPHNALGLTDEQLNSLNKEILMELHEQGIAVPTYTLLQGRYAIRVANVNHRSCRTDFEVLIEAVERIGKNLFLKNIQILPLDPQNAVHLAAFKRINYAWIQQYFTLEPPDIASFEDPQQFYLAKGGCVLLAEFEGEIVGTAALKYLTADSMELSKMGVDEKVKGWGIGKYLGQAIIAKARQMGLKRLYLETNSSLFPALNLYQKLGFEIVKDFETPYQRADVAMELFL